MRFIATADTDVGIIKETNQDSVLIKHAVCDLGEILLAVVCDGMGGLERGELASATVVREFSKWFDEVLPGELEQVNMQVIGGKWSHLLKDLNAKIGEFGEQHHVSLGTTFTGVLFVGNEYVVAHVGDSRLYHIKDTVKQLTTDQTFVAREVRLGNMTEEQAKVDKRRNMLLQCVGASNYVEPEVFWGRTEPGAYMLCSDGFRHEISNAEIYEALNPLRLLNKDVMHNNCRYLIEQVKYRREKDNISVLLIKVD